MRMLICTSCSVTTSLDDDVFGEDNRHAGHATVVVSDADPQALKVKAAKLGVHQGMAGVHRDGSLS